MYIIPTDASYGYFYNWDCVSSYGTHDANTNVLCPYPWRVPSKDDYCTLYKNVAQISNCPSDGVTVENSIANALLTATSGTNAWGAVKEGFYTADVLDRIGTQASFWSSSLVNANAGASFQVRVSPNLIPYGRDGRSLGFQVRCVK
jgi:uncharacterized protein (TIGR02145 family)